MKAVERGVGGFCSGVLSSISRSRIASEIEEIAYVNIDQTFYGFENGTNE